MPPNHTKYSANNKNKNKNPIRSNIGPTTKIKNEYLHLKHQSRFTLTFKTIITSNERTKPFHTIFNLLSQL